MLALIILRFCAGVNILPGPTVPGRSPKPLYGPPLRMGQLGPITIVADVAFPLPAWALEGTPFPLPVPPL